MLNRTIRWTEEGLEYEPDQRHTELIIEQMGMANCKAVTTPTCTEVEYDERLRIASGLMSQRDATVYRGIAARLNYLAQDRVDVQFAAKDAAKHMASPAALDWLKLKRIARYLAGVPRYIQKYVWQHPVSLVNAYADSDWAGDKISRKSTSGGILMIGEHLIKSWSSTQPVIALSSGEAELYALVKAAAQAKGLCSLLADFGFESQISVHTDSIAAIGIVHRRGLGKTRHIEVQYLWVQDNVNRKTMKVEKIGTKENPADMLTKGLKRETIDEHIRFSGGQLVANRSKTALSIHAVNKVMKTIKVNLVKNGGDKRIGCDLNLFENVGTHEPRPLNHRGWTNNKYETTVVGRIGKIHCFIRNSLACRVLLNTGGDVPTSSG